MKHLRINKELLNRLKYAGIGIIIGALGFKIVSDNNDTITIVAKEDMTVQEMAKKLNYSEELLKKLNKKLDKQIEAGEEIVLSKDEIIPLSYRAYTLESEDTIKSLSDKFGLTEETVKEMDEKLKSDASIKENVGKEVIMYNANEEKKETIYYTVEFNDNLSTIASKLHTTIDKIKAENNLETDTIYPNQVLKITTELTNSEKNKLEKREEKVKEKKKEENEPKTMVTKKEQEEQTYGNLKGIDLSQHQENVDIEQVKNYGIDFAMIRMFDAYFMNYQRNSETGELEGTLSKLDYCFQQNVQKCEENNIPYGIYIYTRATTEEQARVEAEKFLKFASKYKINPTYPIYYDLESFDSQPFYDENKERIDSVKFIKENSEQVLKNFKTFANILEENGYYCGIYANDTTLIDIDPNGTELEDYAIWLAKYAYEEQENGFEENVTLRPDYKGKYQMYQFTQTGIVPGINGFTDCNYCKVNYDEIIKKVGMNQALQEDELNKVLTKK